METKREISWEYEVDTLKNKIVLGQGAFGIVYKGDSNGTSVAVKCII